MSTILFENINDTYCRGKCGPFNVIFMISNGYINATKVVAKGSTKNGKKKELYSWKENASTTDFIREAAKEMKLTEDDMIIIKTGGQISEIRGSYVHPILMTHIAYWVSPSFAVKVCSWIEEWKCFSVKNEFGYFNALTHLKMYSANNREKEVQTELHDKLGGKIEVKTPVGRIDLLTKHKLIEIKKYDDWKNALGQLIAYSTYYPDRQKYMYLFGVDDRDTVVIKEICKSNDIKMVVYD